MCGPKEKQKVAVYLSYYEDYKMSPPGQLWLPFCYETRKKGEQLSTKVVLQCIVRGSLSGEEEGGGGEREGQVRAQFLEGRLPFC